MVKKPPGKKFENNFKDSAKKEGVFFHRINDVFIPFEYRSVIKVVKNKYDNFIFSEGHLFPLELKSTAQKSFSFDEKIIKQHQIDNLLEAEQYDGIMPGFVFNFRESDNFTVFVHIQDFIKYKLNTNRKSIPIDFCKEEGVEIKSELKRTNYHYFIGDFIRLAIEKCGTQ